MCADQVIFSDKNEFTDRSSGVLHGLPIRCGTHTLSNYGRRSADLIIGYVWPVRSNFIYDKQYTTYISCIKKHK